MRWIYGDIQSEYITDIQDRMFDEEWEQYGYRKETNPHVTIVPGFENEEDTDLPVTKGFNVSVNGLDYYPNRSKPMVVMLDISDSSRLKSIRKGLLQRIGEENVQYDRHPFHITLFKAGDAGDESDFVLPNEVAESIVQRCEETAIPSNVLVRGLTIDRWIE